MHLSQGAVNTLQFLWATVHDFVYLGAYVALTHLHIIKSKRSIEDRVSDLENKLKGA